MYFRKVTIILLIVALAVTTAAPKRRQKKIRKPTPSGCGCKPKEIQRGCKTSLIESLISPLDIIRPIPVTEIPIIDIPNYRYADPIELNPLGCLLPSIEVPNIGILAPVANLPSVEYISPIELSCGCPGPKCNCRAPAVKLPTCPLRSLDLPCNCQNVPFDNCGCKVNPVYSGCECPNGCQCQITILDLPTSQLPIPVYSDPIYPVLDIPCGCQNVNVYPLDTCGCQRTSVIYSADIVPVPVYSDIQNVPIIYANSPCGCQGPCGCNIKPQCGCVGPCGCNIQPQCGCVGPCGCNIQPQCGCVGPCGCQQLEVGYVYGSPGYGCGCESSAPMYVYSSPTCGCGSPGCGCASPIYDYVAPVYSSPSCGCGSPVCDCVSPVYGSPCCGIPGCGCDSQYLRQVTLQPPFL